MNFLDQQEANSIISVLRSRKSGHIQMTVNSEPPDCHWMIISDVDREFQLPASVDL